MNKEPDDEVNLAMELVYMVKQTGTLPYAGGLFDQDNYYIQLLKAGFRALDIKEEQNQKKQRAENERAKAQARR